MSLPAPDWFETPGTGDKPRTSEEELYARVAEQQAEVPRARASRHAAISLVEPAREYTPMPPWMSGSEYDLADPVSEVRSSAQRRFWSIGVPVAIVVIAVVYFAYRLLPMGQALLG